MWNPIETAPKDGTIVRLRDEQNLYSAVMKWNKKHKRWEGRDFGVMGTRLTTWDKSVCKIHEWSPI